MRSSFVSFPLVALMFAVVTASFFFYSSINSTPALPLISVSGNKFIDADNQEYIFRGVSFSDPDRLEKVGQWNKAYFQAASDWNVNIVRFPIHPEVWRERGEENYLKLLDDGIQWATELGFYVIIDWHSIGDLETELFQHRRYTTTMTETLHFWQTVASRYKDNSTVALYEVFSEPRRRSGEQTTWASYKILLEEIISTIYEQDETAIPLIAGFNWAYDLRPVKDDPISFPGVAYAVHPYPQKREAPWQEKWEADWGFVADTYPLIATEIGFQSGPEALPPVIGDEVYGEAIIDFFNAKGISWAAWVFDPEWTPQLINNWEFEPTPQGIFFREKFLELNN